MSPSKRRDNKTNERGQRWLIVGGALLLAAIAFYLLLVEPGSNDRARSATDTQPALDDIDAKSREAMRDLLRQAGNEE